MISTPVGSQRSPCRSRSRIVLLPSVLKYSPSSTCVPSDSKTSETFSFCGTPSFSLPKSKGWAEGWTSHGVWRCDNASASVCEHIYTCRYALYVLLSVVWVSMHVRMPRVLFVLCNRINGVVANNAGVSSNERTTLCLREMLREMCATRATLSKELSR